jgi:hypothetical protein
VCSVCIQHLPKSGVANGVHQLPARLVHTLYTGQHIHQCLSEYALAPAYLCRSTVANLSQRPVPTACPINTFSAGGGADCTNCAAGSSTNGLVGLTGCIRTSFAMAPGTVVEPEELTWLAVVVWLWLWLACTAGSTSTAGAACQGMTD